MRITLGLTRVLLVATSACSSSESDDLYGVWITPGILSYCRSTKTARGATPTRRTAMTLILLVSHAPVVAAPRCRYGRCVHSLVRVPVPWRAVPDSSAFPSPVVVS